MSGAGKVVLFHLFVVYVIGYIAHTIIAALLKIAVSALYEKRGRPIPTIIDSAVYWFASFATVVGMYAYESQRHEGLGAFISPLIFAVTLVYMDYRQLNHQHIEMREIKANLYGVLCGFLLGGLHYWFG